MRPNSLLFRVLQHRYFKGKSIWEATKGTQPSYGWQSLLHGRQLLNQGILRTIGNGKSTLITDNWIPSSPPRAPRLLPYTNPKLNVQILIDKHTGQWDLEILNDLIEHDDIKIIKKIYIPPGNHNDNFLWQYTKDGQFSVKSGYHFAKSGAPQRVRPPPLDTQPFLTKAIWSSNTASKIKHFLWRVASQIIPSKANLRYRHIPVDPLCTRCCDHEETTMHILFTCPYAREIWWEAGFPVSWTDELGSLEDKVKLILVSSVDTNLTEVNRILPFWILWRLWKSRNELLYSQKMIEGSTTLERARLDTYEWISSFHLDDNDRDFNEGRARPLQKWTCPTSDWVKCNYDVSHYSGALDSGLGWIIRNKFGIVLHAGMGRFEGRPTVEEGEFSALEWAMQARWSLGYKKVIFEGDNLVVNNCINKDHALPRYYFFLDTISKWRKLFSNCKFVRTSRINNRAADMLARRSLMLQDQWKLFQTCPRFLEAIVNKDLN